MMMKMMEMRDKSTKVMYGDETTHGKLGEKNYFDNSCPLIYEVKRTLYGQINL
jgi:hypothetical protein